MDQSITG